MFVLMDLRDAPFNETSGDAAQASADSRHWARGRIEGQQAVLDELGRMALNIARVVEGEVMAVAAQSREPEGVDSVPAAERKAILNGLGLTFTHVSRAIRLTFLLQSKLTQQLERLEGMEQGSAQEVARKKALARKAFEFTRKARIQLVVERVAQGEHPGDGEIVDRFVDEACERMRDDDGFGKLLAGPVSEAIDYLCRQLGLSPDWHKLTQTAWAQEEIRSGKVGSPLAAATRPSAPPPDESGQAFREVGDTLRIVIPPLPPQKPRRRSG
jgi:hypothetical protein